MFLKCGDFFILDIKVGEESLEGVFFFFYVGEGVGILFRGLLERERGVLNVFFKIVNMIISRVVISTIF